MEHQHQDDGYWQTDAIVCSQIGIHAPFLSSNSSYQTCKTQTISQLALSHCIMEKQGLTATQDQRCNPTVYTHAQGTRSSW
jgi:hypothetical protein